MDAIKQEVDSDVKITEHPENSFLKISFKLDPYDDDVIYMGSVVQPFIISDDEDDEFLHISAKRDHDDNIKVKLEESEFPDIKVKVDENWNTIGFTGIINPAIHIKEESGNENKRKTYGLEHQFENQMKVKKIKTKLKKKTSTPKDKTKLSQSAKRSATPSKSSTTEVQITKHTASNRPSGQNTESIQIPKKTKKVPSPSQRSLATNPQKINKNASSKPSGQNTECILIPKKEKDNDIIYMGKVDPLVISDDEDEELLYISTIKNDDIIVKTEKFETPAVKLSITENAGMTADDVIVIDNTEVHIKSENGIEKNRKPCGAEYQSGNKGKSKSAVTKSKHKTGTSKDKINLGKQPSTPSQRLTENAQITNNNSSNRPIQNKEGVPFPSDENQVLTQSLAVAQITNNDASNRPSGQNTESIPISREENQTLTLSLSSTTSAQITNNDVSNRPSQNMECIPIPKKENKCVQTTAMFPKNPDFKSYNDKLGYLYKNSKVYFLKYAKDFQTQDEYMFVYRRLDNMMRVFIKCEEEEFFMKSFYDLVTCKHAFEYNRRKMMPNFIKYISETIQKRRYGLSHPEQRATFSIPEKLVVYGCYFIIKATNTNDGKNLMIICPTYNLGIFRIYNNYMESFQEISNVYSTQPNIIAQRSFEFHQLKEGFLHWMSGR
ncbi:uncharacterized protein LOC123544332 [Mercenaria mercenaria]|uniref:uncharacterized protein LOC123544332 n=1 Tax=Mercenaria mercenaria TaxID=6596 RepID=UPI00234F9355|nr:uncharacterized protein LOC123544332 [Mercenaria mercenaria]XP_053397785.1 uncharacterized protein LOC123544332 [Mercenaria mercenaria]